MVKRLATLITRYRMLFSLLIVLTIAVVALRAMIQRPGSLEPQPISFNHRIHIERVQGIRCQDCHRFVTSQTYAGIPSKFVCFECHEPDADESDPDADAFKPQFATLMAFAQADEEIPWHRVTNVPEHVFFSHRRHVVVAKIDCRECHPKMPDRESPPVRGPITMSMDTCVECHVENTASVDCILCHR